MGPADAAFATKEWLKPKVVIPMHYGTNPLAKGTVAEYLQALGNSPTKVIALRPGDKQEF
jgi:L-ascorbate metabolism protein UlaG (beta-lactamase superfamily)